MRTTEAQRKHVDAIAHLISEIKLYALELGVDPVDLAMDVLGVLLVDAARQGANPKGMLEGWIERVRKLRKFDAAS